MAATQPKFTLTVTMGRDTHTRVLGWESILAILGQTLYAKDEDADIPLYEAGAAHPAYNVRQYAARSELLSEATLRSLVNDPSTEVREELISNQKFKKVAKKADIMRLISYSPRCAELVCGSAGDFQGFDANELFKTLAAHPDPKVRLELAGGYNIPEKWRRALLKDADSDVARKAKQSLQD
jgi:hypothetical protein